MLRQYQEKESAVKSRHALAMETINMKVRAAKFIADFSASSTAF